MLKVFKKRGEGKMKSLVVVAVVLIVSFLALSWFNLPKNQRAKNEALEMSKAGSFVVVDKLVTINHCRVVLADLSDHRFVVSPEDQSLCFTLIPKDRVTVVFNDIASNVLANRSAGYWLTIKRLPW